MLLHKRTIFAAVSTLATQIFFLSPSIAAERECLGNIETFDKKIVQVNVRYKIWFEISAQTALVRVAGREFRAEARRGNSWKGVWLHFNGENEYLSFLPDEGGTLKIQLDRKYWFSGNC
ncbi:hypothetical protein NHH82_13560 [Oxalobacteraceae bacterium OTU3REALA1]|nr:hypothetical protein NHH82_13560 [Oxalobacteraceae bacterium OTU3REALA1]